MRKLPVLQESSCLVEVNRKEFAMEIRVSEMKASDEITIRTHFSDYSFRVIDPDQCLGVLSGGQLGNGQHEAVFVEAIRPANCEPRAFAQLKPGDRAVFHVG